MHTWIIICMYIAIIITELRGWDVIEVEIVCIGKNAALQHKHTSFVTRQVRLQLRFLQFSRPGDESSEALLSADDNTNGLLMWYHKIDPILVES